MAGDRCIKHRKAFIGVCNWCGAHVCEMCVADRNGNKLYCEKCVGQLSTVKRAKVPPLPAQQKTDGSEEPSGRVEPYY